MAEPTASATEELIGAIRLRIVAERSRVAGRIHGIDRELREIDAQIRALTVRSRTSQPRAGRRLRSH